MGANPFETNASDYDRWYDEFPNTYRSEMLAVEALLPPPGRWVEVGVGTGRFAAELGIAEGVEPTEGMAQIARERNIRVFRGCAEAIPLESEAVDGVFFITTLCFVQNVDQALAEATRILRPNGTCLVAMLPRNSMLGRAISAHAEGDIFFKHANLRSRHAVIRSMRQAGLRIETSMQTLCGSPDQFEAAIQGPQPGSDRGSFIVIRARKPHE